MDLNMETSLDWALAYAAVGIKVIPIKPNSKHPRIPKWQEVATTDNTQITDWFNGTEQGIGLALGPQPNGDNLFAIDIDTHGANGYDTLRELVEQHGPLPVTWTQHTGGGGQHLIYRAPADTDIRNQQALGNRLGDGIDIRGRGGQIVAAPSIHPETGNQYQWKPGCEPWNIPVADAPEWIIDKLTAELHEPAVVETSLSFNEDDGFNDFNRSFNWYTELEQQGWTLSHARGNESYWVRPGKHARDGHSAILHEPDGPLNVFTTEISNQMRTAGTINRDGTVVSFSKFAFHAATHHNGDRSAAAKHINPIEDINLGDLVAAIQQTAVTPKTPDNIFINWNSFWDSDKNQADWLVEPVIAKGRGHSLYAKGGTGKSLFTLWLCLQAARQGHQIMYLDYEMTEDDLFDRLLEFGVEPGAEELNNIRYALIPALQPVDDPSGGQQIIELCLETETDLVIIDTFGRSTHGDENESKTVLDFYRHTASKLKQHGVTMLRIDHAGKDVTKGQRGTSAKNDDVDVVWRMTRANGETKLTCDKRRAGWIPEEIKYTETRDPLNFHIEIDVKLAALTAVSSETTAAVKLLDQIGIDEKPGSRTTWNKHPEIQQKMNYRTFYQANRYRKQREHTMNTPDTPEPAEINLDELF